MAVNLRSSSSTPIFAESEPKRSKLIELPFISTFSPNLHGKSLRRNLLKESSSASPAASAFLTLEQPGGKMVELVGAFNELTERMSHATVLSSSSSRLLFKDLKLSIPILQSLPVLLDGSSPLAKALSLAVMVL